MGNRTSAVVISWRATNDSYLNWEFTQVVDLLVCGGRGNVQFKEPEDDNTQHTDHENRKPLLDLNMFVERQDPLYSALQDLARWEDELPARVRDCLL